MRTILAIFFMSLTIYGFRIIIIGEERAEQEISAFVQQIEDVAKKYFKKSKD